MSFTVDEVITQVRRKIAEEDAQNSFFSDANIISSINSALKILCRDLDIPMDFISIDLQRGVREYKLPDDVDNVVNVWFEKNNFNYEIKYVEWDDFLTTYDDKNTGDTLIVYYIREGFDSSSKYSTFIGFYPIPNKEIKVYLNVVKKAPVVSQKTDVINLPDRILNLLVCLVLVELYECDKRYEEANYYYVKYKELATIERIKRKEKIVEYVD